MILGRHRTIRKVMCMVCRWIFLTGTAEDEDALCPKCNQWAATAMLVIKPNDNGREWYEYPK
jgi:hypothetical protein